MTTSISQDEIRLTLNAFNAFIASNDKDIQHIIQRAIDIIDRSIDIFTIERFCFSFNGGKDSTVILHLLRIVIAKRILAKQEIKQTAIVDQLCRLITDYV